MLERIFGKSDDFTSTLNRLNKVVSRLAVVQQDCNNAINLKNINKEEEIKAKIADLYDECVELTLKYLSYLEDQGNPQHALEELENLEETISSTETFFDTFNPEAIGKIITDNHMNIDFYKGKFLLQLQKNRMALKVFQDLMELNDSNDILWTYYGKALLAIENYTDAIKAFEKSIDINWQNADAWAGKGRVYQALGNFPDAIEAFETSLEIDENNPDASFGRNSILYDRNSNSRKSDDDSRIQKPTKISKPDESRTTSDQAPVETAAHLDPQKNERKVFRKPVDAKKASGQKGFQCVSGMFELKALLTKDVIKPLKNPEKYKKFNVTIPNGILLFGPPGCGKTFIVEKLAEEVGYNFQVVPPSRIGSKYIHETSDNIAKIFTDAKNCAPTILFFDEFEALVPKRESLGSEGQFKTEEINEFLTHLNNASKMGILVVGATNQPDLIDSAVMRAGRMDKIILVPPPDLEARKELFSSRLSKVPHSSDMNFEKLAEKTEYYSSSDITAIIEAAGRIAGDQDLDEINQDLMEHVIENSKPSISKSQIESFNAFSHLERK